jgi:hypothetical protein
VRSLWLSRATLVWVLLVTATLLSWEFGHGIGLHGRAASVAVLLVAFVKLRFVMLDFMELRAAPPAMRVAAQGWLLACCAVLVGLFLAGPA